MQSIIQSITLTSFSVAHESLELINWDWLTYQVTTLVENGFLPSTIIITPSSLLRTVTPREVILIGMAVFDIISSVCCFWYLNMAALLTSPELLAAFLPRTPLICWYLKHCVLLVTFTDLEFSFRRFCLFACFLFCYVFFF